MHTLSGDLCGPRYRHTLQSRYKPYKTDNNVGQTHDTVAG